ncbi:MULTISPECIES: hypothetical protein [unclassified Streptomyces]|uniref:hypothetical protein n=1 Tax=unclassified Streptomyces TaxID=2593676 RepID=UPI001319CFC0|nr:MULTISPECIES: hypothetical protein [unclassified Streptomyces]MYT27609.1 hypothetical protein [Streptomyces sp. SID8354]
MRRHFHILTISAALALLTFGFVAPAHAGGSGGKSPRIKTVLNNVPVVGHLLDGLDD